MRNKKAFSLIELILVIAFTSIIAMYAFKTIQHNNFLNAVVKLQDTVKFIINDGIIKGYSQIGGSNCSENYDFKDLNTERFLSCNSYKNGRFKLDITKSFISGNGLMENYGSCRIYMHEGSSRRKFYLYIDCNNVQNTMSIKESTLIEDALKFTFTNELKSINTSVTSIVNTYNPAITPSDDDGIIRADFEL